MVKVQLPSGEIVEVELDPNQVLKGEITYVNGKPTLKTIQVDEGSNASMSLLISKTSAPLERPRGGEEYEISLDRSDGSGLGVDVDNQDGLTLYIEAVHSDQGLIRTWNINNQLCQVMPGDRITEVNGVRADLDAMVERCKQDSVLKMKLVAWDPTVYSMADAAAGIPAVPAAVHHRAQASEEFVIVVDKSDGSSLGIDVDFHDGVSLIIDEIDPEGYPGLITAWNKRYCLCQVVEGDRIVEVNEIRGNPDSMMSECEKNVFLHITLAAREETGADNIVFEGLSPAEQPLPQRDAPQG